MTKRQTNTLTWFDKVAIMFLSCVGGLNYKQALWVLGKEKVVS